MVKPTAQIFVNKVEAARRQIDAAIRMTFANEDELAIHTVAQAAYRILRDLLEKRGRSDTEDLVAAGMYETARALADGILSQEELDHLTGAGSMISSVADRMKAEGEAFTVDKIKVNSDRRAEWRKLTASANFLKHADKDTAAHLSLDEINNGDIIIRATVAYIMVAGQSVGTLRQTPEMSAFHIWWMAEHDPSQLYKEYGSEIAKLMRTSPAKRRRNCLKLVRLFARWGNYILDVSGATGMIGFKETRDGDCQPSKPDLH